MILQRLLCFAQQARARQPCQIPGSVRDGHPEPEPAPVPNPFPQAAPTATSPPHSAVAAGFAFLGFELDLRPARL